MTRLRKVLFVPFFLFLLMGIFPILSLEVRDVDDRRVLFIYPVSKGATFEIRYIHSVEKVPVAGIFRVADKDAIQVVQTVFPSYGAGLPSDTPVEDVVFEGDRMIIRHRHVVMDRLRIFISPFTKQQFIYSDKAVDLSLVEEGHIVEVRAKRNHLFSYWARRLCDVFRFHKIMVPKHG